MSMQLLDYTLNVHYQPGERMHLSDALSRLSSHNMAAGKTIKNLDVSIRAIEELTGFNSISVEKLHQHMASDPDLRLLITSTVASRILQLNVLNVYNHISVSGMNLMD